MKTCTRIALLDILLILATTTQAQNLIAVQNGGTPKFYSILDSAVIKSQNGDTISIPGGIFSLSLEINKQLHIVGVGINPDSTNVTGRSIISSGAISIIHGAEYGSITGIYFTGGVSFGISGNPSSCDIDNFTIDRCFFYDLTFQSSLSNNNTFVNCVIGGINGNNTFGNMFINNFIQGQVKSFANNNYFKNNIFTYLYCGGCYYTSTLLGINDCLFANNIFVNSFFSYQMIYQNNIFLNNINAENGLFGYYQNNNGSNNFTGVLPTLIFQNYSGSSNFSFTDNYHLQNSTLYLGNDGTQVGIYGGAFPWKEGSVPSNPHFQTVKIAPKTDANGSLNVNIKVNAQDN